LKQTLQEKPRKVILGKLGGVEYYYYFAANGRINLYDDIRYIILHFSYIYVILQPEGFCDA